MTVDGATGPAADAWRAALEASLAEEDVSLLDPDAPDAVPVRVEITTSSGTGTTDNGISFESVRFDATLRVRRAVIEVQGLPVTAPTAPDTNAIRDDLIARLVPILAY